MRTSLFNDFVLLRPEFREHLEDFWKLSVEQQEQLISPVIQSLQAETNSDMATIREKVVQAISAPAGILLRSLNVLYYLALNWNPSRDTVQDCIQDIFDLGLIPDERKQESLEFFKKFLVAVEAESLGSLKRLFSGAILPSFQSISTLLDMRGVFEKPFWSTPGSLGEYKSRLLTWVPVVLVQISLDAGDPSTLEFQCTESQLDNLIETLEAARIDLLEGKSKFRGTHEG